MLAKWTIAPYAVLLALACLVQGLLVCRATVPSLDAVRFVYLAERFDEHGWASLGESPDRPLFPLWVWTMHKGLAATVGPFRGDWASSAQLAAAVALILAVVPVYALSVRLVGREAAFLGTALFCVIPEVSQLGANGLGDSVHLLFFALAVWALLEYWMRREESGAVGGWTLLAGLASAAALLARQEAAALPAAFLLTLALFQILPQRLLPQRRQPWLRIAGHLGCFAVGFGLLYGTYLAAVRLASTAAVADAINRT